MTTIETGELLVPKQELITLLQLFAITQHVNICVTRMAMAECANDIEDKWNIYVEDNHITVLCSLSRL